MPPTNIKQIGKYPVLEIISRGGMGVVFKATDPSLHRPVAIKMIRAFEDNPDLLKRFYQEAQSTGNLHHPNIVTVYDMGEHEGNPYIVMQFLEGESLQRLIDERRDLPLLQRIGYLVQICRGLEYAHTRQVIHRDIKPANVVVLKDGTVKIVDFGIARMGELKMTRPGQVIGTPDYMSPEQIRDGPVDHRSDIWAVGVLMFQLLTYELPFRGHDLISTLRKILEDPLPGLSKYLASYPEGLDPILALTLARDKEKRYQSIEDLGFDLAQVERNLKRRVAQEMLELAIEFMDQGQWTSAREKLLEVLKLDPQQAEAHNRMGEVQQQLQELRRGQQVSELRTKAKQLVEEGQFARALAVLEQAVSLDDSPELVQARNEVQQLAESADQIESAWRRSQEARGAGDLDGALLAIREVLRLQSDHKEALEMQASLNNEIAARNRSRELRQLVEVARKEISNRRFDEALMLLKRVEELNPEWPGLQHLTRLASEGQEQQNRRRELQAATGRIEEALNAIDFETAASCLEEALERFPAEASLLQLKAFAEHQRERHERRVWVEDRVSSARKFLSDGNPEEALVRLEDAAQRCPTEPIVQSLLAIAQQSVAQQRTEKRQAELLSLARNALSRNAFEEAVALLEAGRAELNTSDFDDLITFAHDKAATHNRQQRIRAVAGRSQLLVQKQQYAQAIELLGKALQEMPGDELRFLLQEAKVLLQEQQRIEEETLARANQMVEQNRPEEDAMGQQYPQLEEQTHPTVLEPDTRKPVLPGHFERFKDIFNRADAANVSAEQPENAVQQRTPPPSGISGTGEIEAMIERQQETLEYPDDPKVTSDVFPEVNPAPDQPPANHRLPPLVESSSSQGGERTVASFSGSRVQWPADVLSQIERQIAAYVGPLARVIVRRAASKATDWDELFSLAAQSLDTDAERQAFLTLKERLNPGAASRGPASGEPVEPVAAKLAQPTPAMRGDLTVAVVAHATQLLARYLGPIASVLVRKAAQRSDSITAFYLLLADELDAPAERAEFLRETGISDQS